MLDRFKIINGFKAEAKVGYYVKPDGWKFGECLKSSDWDKADFYFPTGYSFGTTEIATNIYTNGRKFIHKDGGIYVRVKIEFVHDGDEENVITHGIMKLLDMEYMGEESIK